MSADPQSPAPPSGETQTLAQLLAQIMTTNKHGAALMADLGRVHVVVHHIDDALPVPEVIDSDFATFREAAR